MNTGTTTLDDGTLIDMALAGRSDCFAVLMDRHLVAIRKCVCSRARNNCQDLDDLVQEVLLKAWRYLPTFRGESTFRTWMTRIAINEVLQHHRKQQRRGYCSQAVDVTSLPSECDSPHQTFVRDEARRTVRRAIEGLPPKFRQILILRDIREMNTLETAHQLQASVPLVKTRLARARLMLSAAIEGQRPVVKYNSTQHSTRLKTLCR